MSDRIHLSLIDRLLAAYERTGAMPLICGGDHDDDGDDEQQDDQQDQQHQDDSEDESLGDKGKETLRKEREARRKAEADAKDLKARLDKIEADARKDAEKKAKEDGKWEELAATREAELTEATTKLTNAESELTTLREYVTSDLDTVAKAVREAAKDNPAAKILMEFHPGNEASTSERIAWTKRAKAQLPELTKQTPRGNGPDPKPRGKTIDDKQALAQTRARVRPI